MRKTILTAFLAISLLLFPSIVLPFETDQFNLPPVPLADIGDEVTEYVEAQLSIVVDAVNSEIVRREKCIETRAKGCDPAEKEWEKLAKLRSAAGLAEAFYEHIAGGNLMTTKFGKWMNSHQFRGQPARYKAPYKESIYVLNPFNYATLSPTVRLYGHEFGIDKLEHLFQQGYRYFKIYNEQIAKGSSPEAATKKAIEWGQKTESTYYGLLTSGVYSNADLFANHAGLKFYQRLNSPIRVGDKTLDRLVDLENGLWKFERIPDVLRSLVADQMNEAFNPSAYRITLVRSVRRSVKKTCGEWMSIVPAILPNRFNATSERLSSWNGEDYGFTSRDRTANLAELCATADDQRPSNSETNASAP